MEQLYLEGCLVKDRIIMPLKSVIVLFILKYLNAFWVDIVIVETFSRTGISIPESSLTGFTWRYSKICDISKKVSNCIFPVMVKKQNLFHIAGLCAVLRNVVKETSKLHSENLCNKLLGFRHGCLMACAEVSVWTKFCEIDMPNATKMMITRLDISAIPNDILRFEKHLRQPVRMHNRGKYEHKVEKNKNRNEASGEGIQDKQRLTLSDADATGYKTVEEDSEISWVVESFDSECSVSTKEGKKQRRRKKAKDDRKVLSSLQHIYAEGIEMTLADLILFPCLHLSLEMLLKSNSEFVHDLLSILAWYKRMSLDLSIVKVIEELLSPVNTEALQHLETNGSAYLHKNNVVLDETNQEMMLENSESLYIRDPNRVSSFSRKYIQQEEIESILQYFQTGGVEVNYEEHPCASVALDWSALPQVVHPSFGELPSSRVLRKCQQVENLVSAVLTIAKPGDTIVDFCSGGGHLGIVIAYMLPHCQIIMIDNKEESLSRALNRVEILDLENVTFYQSNLDYFKGKFTIGTSLHACGVATDLVLQLCQKQNAAVVSCPCCYGAVKNTHSLSFPRSKMYQSCGVSYRSYCVLGHAADQTHLNDPKTEQGQLCMGYIDKDRLGYLSDHGYSTLLCTLVPPSCTPKNNLLIALHTKHRNIFKAIKNK